MIRELEEKSRLNTPHDVRIAVPYYKPTRNQTDLVPDFYLHETAEWIKFPYSLEGLTVDEIRKSRPKIYEIIKDSIPEGRE